MKDNIDLKLINMVYTIENKKKTYFFIGFLIGILPFIIVYNILNKESLFKNIILVFGLITATINSLYLKNKSYTIMKYLFSNTYNQDYTKLKELIKTNNI